jgi:hypothetical protein
LRLGEGPRAFGFSIFDIRRCRSDRRDERLSIEVRRLAQAALQQSCLTGAVAPDG